MENTVAQKLESLVHLQGIDSKLDNIHKMRGTLPLEVQELEDEIVGLEARIDKLSKEITGFKEGISAKKAAIKEDEGLMKMYAEQKSSARNSREIEAIDKDLELKQLEIQLHQKNITEANFRIEEKNKSISIVTEQIGNRKLDLEAKREELNKVNAESQEEEAKYLAEREKAAGAIEERLMFSYTRLRNNARNGLAVVNVKRGACGGCFNIVPPQRQADIREKKRIIVCEHCGRILADVEAGEQIDLTKGRSLAAELVRNTD